MINRSTPVAIATALLLAGCSLIPTYERPAAPVAAQYTRANATAAAEGGTAAAQLPWQDFFQDARLQQLVRTALDNNRDLQNDFGPKVHEGPVRRRAGAGRLSERPDHPLPLHRLHEFRAVG